MNSPLLQKLEHFLCHTYSNVSEFLDENTPLYFLSKWTYVITPIVIYFYYVLWIRPMNRVRKMEDVGYVGEGSFSAKEAANWMQRRRNVGNVPPVFPNGWYGIVESRDLQKGQSVPVNVLGLNLAVFRDVKGVAHALDAYCPHLGANLAVGGRVLGDCLECPFHAWRFRGSDGQCTSIPYTEKIPEFAKVKSWPVDEKNGWIHLWYHAEGEQPTWTLPEVTEITDGTWVYRGRTEHIVNAHIEEIPENGADPAHLNQVHGPSIGAGTDLRHMWTRLWSFSGHRWTAGWEPFPEPDAHVGQLSLTHSLSVFGVRLPFVDLVVKAQQIGPAVVHLKTESLFGKGMFTLCVTPIAPLVVKAVHQFYGPRSLPAPVAKFYMLGEAIHFERDIMVWNNMKYQDHPMFVKSKEDSLISKHRRWYSQFYSKNSPRLRFQKDSLEW